MKDLVKSKYYKPVACGVLTAIVTVATMFLSIPIPGFSGAYMNAGDAAVYLCAFMIGGWWGAACAGIGSALADILLGAMVYAPATFIIKGCMALIAFMIMKRFNGKAKFAALPLAGLIMPLGYFIYETVIAGAATAAVGIPFNLIQYACGVILGALAILGIRKALKIEM